MRQELDNDIKNYDYLVECELKRAETADFVCLTDLLAIKESIIKQEYEKRLQKIAS